MNRVRQLISGQRNQSNRNENLRTDQSQSREQAFLNSNDNNDDIGGSFPNYVDYDDQNTMLGSEFVSDSITLHTAVSEGQTIGDLQRQGFINRAPRFTCYRSLPFVSTVLTKGFFAFPSEESYQTYINNKRRLEKINCHTAVGIPLYHAVSLNIMKSMFNKRLPVTTIYRYFVFDPQSTTQSLPSNAEFVANVISPEEPNLQKSIYKVEFCTVHKEVTDSYRRVEHRFRFYRYRQFESQVSERTEKISDAIDPEIYTYSMFNHTERRHTDTKVGDLNLQWYGTTGFASPFGSSNLKLLILDDNMASMCDQKTMEEYDTYKRRQKVRPLGYLPVWAKYSDASATIIPKKMTLKLATFEIGEENNLNSNDNSDSFQNSKGLYGIPWETEVLTCMAMVLHEYESRKDKRHNAAGSATALSSIGMLTTTNLAFAPL